MSKKLVRKLITPCDSHSAILESNFNGNYLHLNIEIGIYVRLHYYHFDLDNGIVDDFLSVTFDIKQYFINISIPLETNAFLGIQFDSIVLFLTFQTISINKLNKKGTQNFTQHIHELLKHFIALHQYLMIYSIDCMFCDHIFRRIRKQKKR